ncbi:MAG: hypothetical protein ACXADY_13630 [Candidatus Hodarchaeales archaeon]
MLKSKFSFDKKKITKKLIVAYEWQQIVDLTAKDVQEKRSQ